MGSYSSSFSSVWSLLWGGIPAAKRREAHGKCSLPRVVLFAGYSQKQCLGSGMQAEREGGSGAPQIPDLCGCGGTVSRRAGAVLPRAVRSRAGAGRSLGLFRAAGDGGSGAAALPPSPAPTGWRRGPRGTRWRGLGADPAALPAACGGAASETVPGWKWRVPLRGFPVWKPGSALCPPCTGTGGCKRWRFQRQGCRWAPFLTGLCIEGMLLSTDEIFYTKCKGGG